MVLKGLPETFKPFGIHVTQGEAEAKMTFAEFKTKLRSYEDVESMRATVSEDNVMKARAQFGTKRAPVGAKDNYMDIVCYKCGGNGHIARSCSRKRWCNICKSNTHNSANCRRNKQRDDVRKAADETGDKEYAFRICDSEESARDVKSKGLMVDAGATSHIITDIAKFKTFESGFQAGTHCVELADGSRSKGVAKRRGDAEV